MVGSRAQLLRDANVLRLVSIYFDFLGPMHVGTGKIV